MIPIFRRIFKLATVLRFQSLIGLITRGISRYSLYESFSVVAIFLEDHPLGIFALYNLNFFYAFDQTVCS